MTGSKPGWWNHTRQADWNAADWGEWERQGSPRLPPAMRLGADDPWPITTPYVAPTHTVPDGFCLQPSGRSSRDARGRAIDKLLDRHLGRR